MSRARRSAAPRVSARPVDQPPAGRLQVDRQVDEERGAPADHVGAEPAGGQLGHVRQVGQLAEDDLDASAGSVPGIEPTPVAAPAKCTSVTRDPIGPAIVGGLRQHRRHVRGSVRRRPTWSGTSAAPGRGGPAGPGPCCRTAAST